MPGKEANAAGPQAPTQAQAQPTGRAKAGGRARGAGRRGPAAGAESDEEEAGEEDSKGEEGQGAGGHRRRQVKGPAKAAQRTSAAQEWSAVMPSVVLMVRQADQSCLDEARKVPNTRKAAHFT